MKSAQSSLAGGGRGRGSPDAAYRGIFRLLSEEYIPFGVVDNLAWLGKRDADIVIATHGAPQELEPWVREGGRLLPIGPTAPPFDLGKPVKLWKNVQGYFRADGYTAFTLPALAQYELVELP